MADIFELNLAELQNEYLTDRVWKQIYESNFTKELLQVAEEKAEYRKNFKTKSIMKIVSFFAGAGGL